MDYIKFETSRPEQVREKLKQSPIAFVPVGSLEWHGEHNPLGLDGLKAYALCEKVAQKTGGVLFPPIYWGASDTIPFPFTFRFHRAIYKTIIRQTLLQLKEMGFKIIVLLTGHYPPFLIKLLRKECRRFNRRGGAFAIGGPEQMFGFELNYYGDHAGMWETSIMMALAPELVKLDLLPSGLSAIERMTKLGLMGKDPKTGASAEKGQQVIEIIVSRLREVIERTLKENNNLAIEEAYQAYANALKWYLPKIFYVIKEALDVHYFRELLKYGWANFRKMR